jgi:hypothetical protein
MIREKTRHVSIIYLHTIGQHSVTGSSFLGAGNIAL